MKTIIITVISDSVTKKIDIPYNSSVNDVIIYIMNNSKQLNLVLEEKPISLLNLHGKELPKNLKLRGNVSLTIG